MRDNIINHQMHTLDSPSVITFSTERPRMLASWYFIAQNAPTESCRCTTRIPWYHQNPAYTHRILFALTAWEQQSPLTLPNFGFNRKPTNRFHQRFTNSISKYLLLGSNPGVPTVEITSRPRPRVVDNCAFIGFCILDWAVPRATKII